LGHKANWPKFKTWPLRWIIMLLILRIVSQWFLAALAHLKELILQHFPFMFIHPYINTHMDYVPGLHMCHMQQTALSGLTPGRFRTCTSPRSVAGLDMYIWKRGHRNAYALKLNKTFLKFQINYLFVCVWVAVPVWACSQMLISISDIRVCQTRSSQSKVPGSIPVGGPFFIWAHGFWWRSCQTRSYALQAQYFQGFQIWVQIHSNI